MAEWLRALILHYHTLPLDHLTMDHPLVWIEDTHRAHETCQVLLADVPGVISRGSPVFSPTY